MGVLYVVYWCIIIYHIVLQKLRNITSMCIIKKVYSKKSGRSGRNWNFVFVTAWLSHTISTSYFFNKVYEMVEMYVILPVNVAIKRSTTFKSKVVEKIPKVE